MPVQSQSFSSDRERLASLQKRPDLEIEGAIRPLTTYIVEEGRYKWPATALWVEVGTGLVRGLRVIVPEDSEDRGVREAIAGLVSALCKPGRSVIDGGESLSEPGLPRRVLVDDQILADAVRKLLEGLDVEVVLCTALPTLDASHRIVNAAMVGGKSRQPRPPFSWSVDTTLLLPLFLAAKQFAERAPWEHLNDQPPILVTFGGDVPAWQNSQRLYGCVLGSIGLSRGIVFYGTLADLEETLEEDNMTMVENESLNPIIAEMGRIGIAIDQMDRDQLLMDAHNVAVERGMTPETTWKADSLVLYFNSLDECDPTYLRWLQERGLPVASENSIPNFWRTGEGDEPRYLTEHEVYILTLALQAVNAFVDRFRRYLAVSKVPEEPLVAWISVPAPAGEHHVEVRWPFV